MSMGQELAVAVQEAINKHLPGEIGNLLRQRLTEADQDRTKVTTLSAMVKERDERIEALSRAIREEGTINARLEKVAEAEKKVAAQQLTIDHRLELANLRRECAELTKNEIKEVVQTLFRAPMTKEIITNSKSIPIIKDGYQHGNATETRTDTKITEVGGDPNKQN